MENQYTVPIALIVFKRVRLAEKMLKCLEKIRPMKLFIISDGAREDVPGEKDSVEFVRALFERVSWPCEIYRDYSEKNMGCDMRVPSGISWVFGHVDEAVILEDDCIPTNDFFVYAEKMLEKYKNDPKVMMIAGSNCMQGYSVKDCCCFSARTYTWGWATWKRAWKYYCNDGSAWEEIQKNGTFRKTYPMRMRHFVKKELDFYYGQQKMPWDYMWWISCMKHQGLCAVPKVNLISNEGFGKDATHTQVLGSYNGQTYSLDFPLKFPKTVKRDWKIDKYDRGLNRPWLMVRLFWKMKKILLQRL